MTPHRRAARAPGTRTGVLVASAATVLALWLGLTAPSVSPVTPPLPPPVTSAPVTSAPAVPGPAAP